MLSAPSIRELLRLAESATTDRLLRLADKANAWRASGMLTDGEWRAVMAVLTVESIRALTEDEYAAILAHDETDDMCIKHEEDR